VTAVQPGHMDIMRAERIQDTEGHLVVRADQCPGQSALAFQARSWRVTWYPSGSAKVKVRPKGPSIGGGYDVAQCECDGLRLEDDGGADDTARVYRL
jgi:hypothetical protein